MRRAAMLLLLVLYLATGQEAVAGGPRYVAGSTYFDPSVMGQPILWQSGAISYFVDPGPLNATIANQQAVAMVDAAAAVWNAVPTAAIALTDAGPLAEDVSGANSVVENGRFTQPADVTAQNTTEPIAIVFDADGSIIDLLDGEYASEPDNCSQNGVLVWLDNVTTLAVARHGVILLNGRCATTAPLMSLMEYQLERAFGTLLNLNASQVNPDALTDAASEPTAAQAWGVMAAMNGACGGAGGVCVPEQATTAPYVAPLSYDDQATVSRMYPVTAANEANFPGKQLTAANTVSVTGTVSFEQGNDLVAPGMQGVNVVLRPVDASGNVLYQYTATAVTGARFCGQHPNPVMGTRSTTEDPIDYDGPLTDYCATDASQQGAFDLSAVPLPPGMTSATYQLSFEPINANYILEDEVGPYYWGTPAPSGTLATMTLSLSAGAAKTVNVTAAGSATASVDTAIGSLGTPAQLNATGMWQGRLSSVGQTDWLSFPIAANRPFTIVAIATDENGNPTDSKAMPALGVWTTTDDPSTLPEVAAPAQNGTATGETWLQVSSGSDATIRLAVADQRGDGRPDYGYQAWVLYAATVAPTRLPAAGAAIVIRGMGFRADDTVTIGGQLATITAITPNEIDAIAPAAASGVTGAQDVTVSEPAAYNAFATIPGGVSYGAAANDALTVVAEPGASSPMGVPAAFTVKVTDGAGSPVAGVAVTYAVAGGAAGLGCNAATCIATTDESGEATVTVTPIQAALSTVAASLSNGATVEAIFAGVVATELTALTPTLHVAAGSTFDWSASVLALGTNNTPIAGLDIILNLNSITDILAPSSAVATNANGVAALDLTIGPLTANLSLTLPACILSLLTCTSFTIVGSDATLATLGALSGSTQVMAAGTAPAPVTLAVQDAAGNPLAGATVAVYQSLYAWTPPCTGQGRCAAAPLLQQQTLSLTSAADGTVTFTPISASGQATQLSGIATTGNTGTAAFSVEVHP